MNDDSTSDAVLLPPPDDNHHSNGNGNGNGKVLQFQQPPEPRPGPNCIRQSYCRPEEITWCGENIEPFGTESYLRGADEVLYRLHAESISEAEICPKCLIRIRAWANPLPPAFVDDGARTVPQDDENLNEAYRDAFFGSLRPEVADVYLALRAIDDADADGRREDGDKAVEAFFQRMAQLPQRILIDDGDLDLRLTWQGKLRDGFVEVRNAWVADYAESHPEERPYWPADTVTVLLINEYLLRVESAMTAANIALFSECMVSVNATLAKQGVVLAPTAVTIGGIKKAVNKLTNENRSELCRRLNIDEDEFPTGGRNRRSRKKDADMIIAITLRLGARTTLRKIMENWDDFKFDPANNKDGLTETGHYNKKDHALRARIKECQKAGYLPQGEWPEVRNQILATAPATQN